MTPALSGTTSATRRGRNPVQAGRVGAAWSGGGVDELAERILPTGAQRGDVEREPHELDVAVGQVEQCVDVGDADPVPAGGRLHDLVARLHPAFGDDAQVEAGPVVGDEQLGHVRAAEAHPDAGSRSPAVG